MQDRPEYLQLKQDLARGWNTWNTYSVLSHVLLPHGLAINLGIKEYQSGGFLREALIGRTDPAQEQIHPGPRTYDGSYTELTLRWRGIELLIQSATDGDDLVLLVTPRANQLIPATLVIQAGFMWNRPGHVRREGDRLFATAPNRAISVVASGTPVDDRTLPAVGNYLAVRLDQPVAVTTGKPRTPHDAAGLMTRRREDALARHEPFGDLAEAHSAIQSCLAWDTIYDPASERVVSPVSRIWSSGQGGWVLFCWDTYFAAYLAAVDNKAIAYANAVEITREMAKTPAGFVPNVANAHGFVSRDRSQPPVGATVVRELYRKFGDRWLLEMLFDDLLGWSRWWSTHRMLDGLLAWGSNPYDKVTGNEWEDAQRGVGGRFGGALESGLDNSPMYDDLPFNAQTHTLALQDVGLTGLYIADCEALADIARVLGRDAEATELTDRGRQISAAVERLWNDAAGIYCNRRTDNDTFSPRVSPTNFYALFSRGVPREHVERMLKEHFYNPGKFWGEFVMPSISRDDPAYPEQSYWRGRIWAPLNFLVYLALCRHDVPQAKKDLADKSVHLLLQEWRAHGHVCEHYDADTGWGTIKQGAYGADRFYHWGGLLGLIGLIEAGHLPDPAKPLGS